MFLDNSTKSPNVSSLWPLQPMLLQVMVHPFRLTTRT